MSYGCVHAVRSAKGKGDDAAWCGASPQGIGAVVADGISIVDVESGGEVLREVVKSRFVAEQAVKTFQDLYHCALDSKCFSEIIKTGVYDLVSIYFNRSVDAVELFIDMKNVFIGLKRLIYRAWELLLGRGNVDRVELKGATTIAGALYTGNYAMVMSSGDSTAALFLCPSLKKFEMERANLNYIVHVMLGGIRALYTLDLEPAFSKVEFRVDAEMPRFKTVPQPGRIRGEIRLLNPIVQILPVQSLDALSQTFGGVVAIAWTDGINLDYPLRPLQRDKSTNSYVYGDKPLEHVLRALDNAGLSGYKLTFEKLAKDPVYAAKLKVIDVLSTLSCLAGLELVSIDALKRLVEELLDAKPPAEDMDDRSISLSYVSPPPAPEKFS